MDDLLALEAWRFYDPPNPAVRIPDRDDEGAGQKARRWEWDAGPGDYCRAMTLAAVTVPCTFTVAFQWRENLDPGYQHAGLHFGLIQDEHHGYWYSIRADGRQMWQQEDHTRGTAADGFYDRLAVAPHGARPDGVRHQVRLTFGYHALAADLNGHHGGSLRAELTRDRTRWPNLLVGHPALRVDRQRLWVNAIAVG